MPVTIINNNTGGGGGTTIINQGAELLPINYYNDFANAPKTFAAGNNAYTKVLDAFIPFTHDRGVVKMQTVINYLAGIFNGVKDTVIYVSPFYFSANSVSINLGASTDRNQNGSVVLDVYVYYQKISATEIQAKYIYYVAVKRESGNTIQSNAANNFGLNTVSLNPNFNNHNRLELNIQRTDADPNDLDIAIQSTAIEFERTDTIN